MKILFFLQLLALGTSITHAYSQSSLEVGLGLSYSHISMKASTINVQNMWSQDFNINFYRPISQKFLYNVGLHYQPNKFVIQRQNGTTNQYNSSFFRMPISIGYCAIDKKVNLSIIGGPYVGLLLNANENIYVRNTIGGEVISFHQNNIKGNWNNLDYGLHLGVKFGLNNGLSFNGKYWYSMNKINYNLINNENVSFVTLGLAYDINKIFY